MDLERLLGELPAKQRAPDPLHKDPWFVGGRGARAERPIGEFCEGERAPRPEASDEHGPEGSAMRLDNLIDELASDVPALPRSAVTQRLAIGTGAGAVIALGLLLAFLGLRPSTSSVRRRPCTFDEMGLHGELGSLGCLRAAQGPTA